MFVKHHIEAKPTLTNYGRGMFFYLPKKWVEERHLANKDVLLVINEKDVVTCGKVGLYKGFGAIHVRQKYIPLFEREVKERMPVRINLVEVVNQVK